MVYVVSGPTKGAAEMVNDVREKTVPVEYALVDDFLGSVRSNCPLGASVLEKISVTLETN